MAQPMQPIYESGGLIPYGQQLDEDLKGRKARWWICGALILTWLCFATYNNTAKADAYGYKNRHDCVADANSQYSSTAYSEKFDTEIGLIANGEHNYYRLDSQPGQCFEVPQGLRTQATIHTVINVATVTGPIIITGVGRASGLIISKVNKVLAALGLGAIWESIATVPNSPVKGGFEIVVDAGKMMTESQMADPCALLTITPSAAAASVAGIAVAQCRAALPASTELRAEQRKAVQIQSIPNLPSGHAEVIRRTRNQETADWLRRYRDRVIDDDESDQ